MQHHPPQPPQAGPPPGWYPDSFGVPRWWDGHTWGPSAPTAPPQSVEESGKVLALVSWLGYFVVYGLVAVVVRVVEADGNRFARWHAAEAVNFQLTVMLAWLVLLPAWIVGLVLTTDSSGSEAPPAVFFLIWPIMMLVGLASVAVVVLGAVRAAQGVWWRCPVAIPFLRRHLREGRSQP